MPDKRIVLIGKTGSGKSSLGNNLLKQKIFRASTSANSVTKVCEEGERRLSDGTKLKVVDTPGLFDTFVSNNDQVSELARSLQLCQPGVHAFLFVLKIGRFTEEEKATMDHLQEVFGDEILEHMIIVLTGKDDLDDDEIDLDTYLSGIPNSLKTVIEKCDNRVAAINNRSSGQSLNADVDCILDLVEKLMERYGSNHLYTQRMYTRLREREREHENQLEMLMRILDSQRYEFYRLTSHSEDDGCTIL